MNIDEAARATRRWNSAYVYGYGKEQSRWVVCDGEKEITIDGGQHDAQAACDRLNLVAVLEMLREPEQSMVDAAPKADMKTLHGAVYIWRAMIDALVFETKETPDEVIREAAESEHPFDKEREIVEAVLSAVYPRSTAAPLVRLGIACRPANRDPEYWATTECRRIDYRFTAPDRETAKRMVAEKYGSVRFTR